MTPDPKEPELDKWNFLVIKALSKKLIEEMEKAKFPDMALRFDMTVPLARYYGNHANDLPKPFRCYHIGPVWRADRPQKGRFREFYQCDIDIVGGTSDNYEVELLLATDRVLKALNIGKFKIRISHKQLLSELLSGFGVDAGGVAKIAVAIDKLDKQPYEQVWKEIETLGHSLEVLNKVDGFIKNALNKQVDPVHYKIGQAEKLWLHIESIRQKVHEINPEANVVFDPLLVRGFDYYTGPVFEINVEDKDFTFSIGGGGRYDGLIEKLGGPKNTPAVGLSLGFERILTILMEKEGGISKTLQQRVYIVNDGKSEKDIQVLAETLRSHGVAVETGLEKKDKVKQLVAAQGSGLEYAITDFVPGAATFKVRQLSNRQDKEMSAEELRILLTKLA
jgi:histidyl-tRNA synthetase